MPSKLQHLNLRGASLQWQRRRQLQPQPTAGSMDHHWARTQSLPLPPAAPPPPALSPRLTPHPAPHRWVSWALRCSCRRCPWRPSLDYRPTVAAARPSLLPWGCPSRCPSTSGPLAGCMAPLGGGCVLLTGFALRSATTQAASRRCWTMCGSTRNASRCVLGGGGEMHGHAGRGADAGHRQCAYAHATPSLHPCRPSAACACPARPRLAASSPLSASPRTTWQSCTT